MKYMILTYGYDAADERSNIATLDKAINTLDRMAKKWCKEHDVEPEEADYKKGDKIFQCGLDERGACTYEIREVPDFKNKVEELLWEAKIKMDYAMYDAEDYKWSLQECCVDTHAIVAQELIDKALKEMKS